MLAPRRRWFQVSVRTLLAIVAVLALWLAWGMHWVKSRNDAMRELKADPRVAIVYQGGVLPPKPWRELPVTLRLLQAEPVAFIRLDGNHFVQDDAEILQALFPEASVTK